jgi:hypothetical protein
MNLIIRLKSSIGFGAVETILLLTVFVTLMFSVGLFIFRDNHKASVQRPASNLLLVGTSSTALLILRGEEGNFQNTINLRKNVSHEDAITILNDINALSSRPASGGVYNCPNDDGVEFIFDFTNPNVSILASASGCSWVTVSKHSYWTTSKFWNDVSMVIGQSYDPSLQSE